MPAPVVVTDEAIIEAGRAMFAQGRRVTGWTLRGVLNAGNAARLGEVWAAHLAAFPFAEPEAMPPLVLLPAVLEEQASSLRDRLCADLSALVLTTWQTAERTASERVHAEAVAARETASGIAADLDAAAAALASVETERDALVVERDALSSLVVQQREDLQRQEGSLRASGHELTLQGEYLRQIRCEIEETRRLYDSNYSDLAAHRERLARALVDVTDTEERLSVMAVSVAEAEERRVKAEARAEEAQRACDGFATDLDRVRAQALADATVAAEERGRLFARVERAEAELAASVAAKPAAKRTRKPKADAVALAS